MKKELVVVSCLMLCASGCVKKEELEAYKQQVDQKLNCLERYITYYEEPVVFEFHELKVKDTKITATIRSIDDRIKGKTIYMDVSLVIKSGDTFIKESSDYFLVSDGLGKVETEFWLSSEEKNKIVPIKGVQVEIVLQGWGEMFPGVIKTI